MQDKISARLDLFMSDEFAVILNNHELHGEYAGCRSINVTGDVRIIYEKHGGDVQFLMDFGTHGQLYE
jgi:addiction module RelE/StbE family toxin